MRGRAHGSRRHLSLAGGVNPNSVTGESRLAAVISTDTDRRSTHTITLKGTIPPISDSNPPPTLTEYARGRWWQWRLPLLAALGWDVLAELRDYENPSIFAGITFGSHEFGHLFFSFGGEVLTVAGGSLMQLLIPIGAGALLYYHRDYFGVAVAGTWLAASMFGLAVYIADAREFNLDLLGMGDASGHDWNWLLGHFHALPYDLRIAGLVRGAGVLILVTSLAFGLWLCGKMWRDSTPSEGQPPN